MELDFDEKTVFLVPAFLFRIRYSSINPVEMSTYLLLFSFLVIWWEGLFKTTEVLATPTFSL